MAYYDYHCDQCNKTFEVQQSINDPHLQECPKCRENGIDSSPPKKLISLSSFHLKGSGWGNTGYS